ncbi:MAG: hypothetical protein R3C02_14985 [Planctomycetaceae bacterium]
MSSPQLFVIIVAVPLTFAMTCLADDPPASLPSHVSNDSFVAVRLNDGHLTQGVVDGRTDEERLWLRVELPSTRLISGFRWTQIEEISPTSPPLMEPAPFIAPDLVSPLIPSVPELDKLHPENPFEHRLTQPTIPHDPEYDPAHAIASIHIDAILANWDFDALQDGLLVRITALDDYGHAVPLRGSVDLTLIGRRFDPPSYCTRHFERRFPTLERWTVRLNPDDFLNDCTTIKLPYRRLSRIDDDILSPYARLHARLRVPGVGSFEAIDDNVLWSERSLSEFPLRQPFSAIDHLGLNP